MGNPLSRSKPKPQKKVRFNLVFENIIEKNRIVLDSIYDITDKETQANVYKRVQSLKRKHSDDVEEELSSDKILEPASKKVHFIPQIDGRELRSENSLESEVFNQKELADKDLSLKATTVDDNNNTIEANCLNDNSLENETSTQVFTQKVKLALYEATENIDRRMCDLEMVTIKKVQALEARIIDLENKINLTTNKGA